MEYIKMLPHALWEIYIDIAPFVALGLFFAGLLHAFVNKRTVTRYLGGTHGFRSIFYATLVGVPLPLCSCGVIPTAAALRKHGASPGATGAFLLATPQIGVDSVTATFFILGPLFGTIRIIAAVVTGIFGGLLIHFFGTDTANTENLAVEEDDEQKRTFGQRLASIFTYGYGEMLGSLSAPLLFGIIAAGVMHAYLPSDFFLGLELGPWLEMIIVALVSIPFYICSTAAIPIGAMLIGKGLSCGAAFVFLAAGPVTNIAALFMIRTIFGTRQLMLFLAAIFVSALCFGWVVNIGAEHFPPLIAAETGAHHCSPWSIKGIVTILFSIPFAWALIQRFILPLFKKNDASAPCCCGGANTTKDDA